MRQGAKFRHIHTRTSPQIADLWTTIKEPLKMKLTKGECRRLNFLARSYEAANFDPDYFEDCDALCDEVKDIWPQVLPDTPLPPLPCITLGGRELESTPTQHRELTGAKFNYAAGAGAIYDKYMVPIEDVMGLLAKFHDFDESLLRAWKDSGIEEGLETLYDAIEIYDNVWITIANVGTRCFG